MPAKVTKFDSFNPEAEYDEREKPIHKPESVGTCCICNNGSSWCVPEQNSGSWVTLYTAHTFAYWYS